MHEMEPQKLQYTRPGIKQMQLTRAYINNVYNLDYNLTIAIAIESLAIAID